MTPLVSCLMVTWNRPLWVEMSLQCFFNQDYPNLELVIVDDGEPVKNLIPLGALDTGKVQYIHCSHRLPVGVKHNLSHHAARGEILTAWPDDDWCHPTRISQQVAHLLSTGAEVTAIERVPYVDMITGERLLFDVPGHALDGTYLYWRRYYDDRKPFPRKTAQESAAFFAGGPTPALLDAPHLYFGTRHATNAWTGVIASNLWVPDPDPAAWPVPEPLCKLMSHPRINQRVIQHEVVFKFSAWTGDDAQWEREIPERQVAEIVRRMLLQEAFKDYDFQVPLVVMFQHEAYRILDAHGTHTPYTLAFNPSDVEAA